MSTFQIETRRVRQWNSEQKLKYRLPDELWILVDSFLLEKWHRELKKVCISRFLFSSNLWHVKQEMLIFGNYIKERYALLSTR